MDIASLLPGREFEGAAAEADESADADEAANCGAASREDREGFEDDGCILCCAKCCLR